MSTVLNSLLVVAIIIGAAIVIDLTVKILKAERALKAEQEYIKSQKELAECLDRWLTKNETKKRKKYVTTKRNRACMYVVSKHGQISLRNSNKFSKLITKAAVDNRAFNNRDDAEAMARKIKSMRINNGTRS